MPLFTELTLQGRTSPLILNLASDMIANCFHNHCNTHIHPKHPNDQIDSRMGGWRLSRRKAPLELACGLRVNSQPCENHETRRSGKKPQAASDLKRTGVG